MELKKKKKWAKILEMHSSGGHNHLAVTRASERSRERRMEN